MVITNREKTPIEDLALGAVMIRHWIPEVFPANDKGQVPFVRAVMESVATAIDRVVAEYDEPTQKRDLHLKVITLTRAIERIWTAQLYRHDDLNKGISDEMANAINLASEAIGYSPRFGDR